MLIYRSIDKFDDINSSIVTIGNFDGIHSGHLSIVNKAVHLANEKNIESVVITFDPHPKTILFTSKLPENYQISTIEKKISIFEKVGIDILLIIPFDLELSHIDAEDFLKTFIINKFNPVDIIVGYDHHFGHNRKGDYKLLVKNSIKFGYSAHQIDGVELEGYIISSTQIRKYISEGNIRKANEMLGWDYEITGHVVKGDGNGNRLGFPTANIIPNAESQIIPKQGVYKVNVKIENIKYSGMCNIGMRPTFNGNDVKIEVNIFTDKYLKLYGKELTIEFIEFLREEIHFTSIELLISQLEKDKMRCLELE